MTIQSATVTPPRNPATPLAELLQLLHLPAADSTALDGYAFQHRRVKAEQALYRAGESFENLYFVYSGALKQVHYSDEGTECVLAFPMKADLLGLDGICDQRYQVDAVALMDVDVIVLPFRSLLSLTHNIPALEGFLYNAISHHMAREQVAKSQLGHLRAEARLARFLLLLSARFEAMGCSSNCFLLRMTRQDIGSYLGMTLETVSRSLSALAATGLITVDQRAITLLDKPALRTLQRLVKPSPLQHAAVHDGFVASQRRSTSPAHSLAAYA